MAFFTYGQNNSGGSFHTDEKAGIGYYVIVEAKDTIEADQRAESIGLYFNGVADDRDCECCGDRWSTSWNEGDDVPSIYGTPIDSDHSDMWGLPSFIHYLNGEIKKV